MFVIDFKTIVYILLKLETRMSCIAKYLVLASINERKRIKIYLNVYLHFSSSSSETSWSSCSSSLSSFLSTVALIEVGSAFLSVEADFFMAEVDFFFFLAAPVLPLPPAFFLINFSFYSFLIFCASLGITSTPFLYFLDSFFPCSVSVGSVTVLGPSKVTSRPLSLLDLK